MSSTFKRYDMFSFKLAVLKNSQKFLSCPTPDWDYIFCIEEGDPKDYFCCALCKQEYCLNWESQWHDDLSCKVYQQQYGKGNLMFEDKQAIDHALEHGMVRWPHWGFYVYKVDGCNYMSWVWGNEFWYEWGQRFDGENGECDW